MSMGFLNPGDKPLVWRGPMLHSVIQQFLRGVDWGELDYLIIDLPPGTGDVQLSLIQTAPLTGAVVVTTPSDVSLEDARKAIHMFQQVRVPILGMVENMSYLQCPHCNERIDVFSHGGGKKTAETMGVPFLGELPLDPAVRIGGDTGQPITLGDAGAPFVAIAREVQRRAAEESGKKGPSIRSKNRLRAIFVRSSPLMKSRFIRAITSSVISFGHTASHSPMLVQLPNPSALILRAPCAARAHAAPAGLAAASPRCEIFAPVNSAAEAFGHAATQAPQPMQAAASMARSASSLGTRIVLPSGALPVGTVM